MQLKGRVIAGKYRHRLLEVLADSHTRSTKDRVKEGVFSSLNDELNNSVVLDLFAGSGALGIEALSRGARKAIFCDNDIKAIEVIKSNLKMIEETTSVVNSDYETFLLDFDKQSVDIVFVDPPYAFDLNIVLEKIINSKILKDKYILVFESDKKFAPLIANTKMKEFKYGITYVTIIRGENK